MFGIDVFNWDPYWQIRLVPIDFESSWYYFEKMSSSILLVGLARVNIFQLMSTEERSPILTCLMDLGQGSENWKGGGGTTMLPGILAVREVLRPVPSVTAVAASLITSSSLVLFLRERLVD